MKYYCKKSIRALQVAGMNKTKQKGDTYSVCMLVEFYRKTPNQVSE